MAEPTTLDELRRRVALNPASIAFAALAEEYRRAGRFEDAIEVCRAGLRRHPNYVSARVTLASTLAAAGRRDEAEREFEAVLATSPENLAALHGLARLHEPQVGVANPSARAAAAGETAVLPQAVDVPQQPAPSTPGAMCKLAALDDLLAGIQRTRRRGALS